MSSATKTRRVWSEKEDETLREAASKQQAASGLVKDWNKVSLSLPGRTNKDCRKRWGKISKEVKKGPWDALEDQRLQQAVLTLGPRWTNVAELVGTRHADQCAKRWTNSLDPELDQSTWKPREDDILALAVERRGHDWKNIAKTDLPGRSKAAIKNRYAILQNRRRRQQDLERSSISGTSRPVSPTMSDDEDDSDDEIDEEMVDCQSGEAANTVPHTTLSAELQMDGFGQPPIWSASGWDTMDSSRSSNPANLQQLDPTSCNNGFDPSFALLDNYTYDPLSDFTSTNTNPTQLPTMPMPASAGQLMLGNENFSLMASLPDANSRPQISTNASSSSEDSASSAPPTDPLETQHSRMSSTDRESTSAVSSTMNTSCASYKTTLELYNVSESALSRIMSIAIQNRIKVRLEMQHSSLQDNSNP